MRVVLTLLALLSFTPALAEPALPALAADPAKVTVSGLSSGGYMAMQYGVAFSGEVKGVGIVAGGPYHCAAIYGLVFYAFYPTCMQGHPDGKTSWEAAKALAQGKAIDPVSNIATQRIYLFHGTADAVVATGVMDAVRDFYRAAKVPAARLAYVNTLKAGHAFIATGATNACDANATPYVDRCAARGGSYDQPAAILTQVIGKLQPAATTLSAEPTPFDQRPFLAPGARMAPTGYVYVPAACRAGGAACGVHVVFHGCEQSKETVGDAVYAGVGYNRWADANGLIVLYPQVDKDMAALNPKGCWDWWAYTDAAFATQKGSQLASVHAMVKQLTAKP